ncbi:hypothetical protein [Porphyromonas circumdentaria]|uniref:hypothetical protein n=1 Tax=Porphyromonas circumdentaria TaxID=29524 RepID=UPI0026DD04C3|nr:hypothetical protein [Porphyromonas circumdentaria]MDO4722730.1 hypothetical protein [Porphyromonas circumdentaria]
MAVTKSRRISSGVLLLLLAISVVVFVALFMGGSHVEGTNKIYELTGAYLYWAYILAGITLLTTVCFSFSSFFAVFSRNPKKGITSLVSIIALFVLLGVTYAMGDGNAEAMRGVNEDSQKYLTEGWLKTSDMVLYSSYVLIVAIVLAMIWGAIRKAVSKK